MRQGDPDEPDAVWDYGAPAPAQRERPLIWGQDGRKAPARSHFHTRHTPPPLASASGAANVVRLTLVPPPSSG